MLHRISDRDGDEGPGRALTIDQVARLIAALTEAAKEIGR